jgi:tetratricopeptide (TPR) repeat protein
MNFANPIVSSRKAMNLNASLLSRRFRVALATALLASAAVTSSLAANKSKAPLFDDIGTLNHPVKTSSELAQRYFNQGLALAFGFNHSEATRSFQAAAEIDPDCAMAWWGIAYANGPHVNAPMLPEQVDIAWNAIRKAQTLKAKASPMERDYIDAMAKRYSEKPIEDRSSYDKAYAEAMRALYKKYPYDLDSAVLYSEAVMDTMPWDYWTKDLQPKPEMKEVIATLENVIARNPDHPGANHLYIHAVEAGPRPQDALAAADRLAKYSSILGHLVHMPSHIYVRVGRFDDAIKVNELASAADERYIDASKAQGFYPGAYYPHNVHFLWFANVWAGRSQEAIAAAKKVSEYAALEMCGTPKVEAIRQRHVPLLAYARFGRWDDILAAKAPDTKAADTVFDRAMWLYARATAFAAKGKVASAEQEAAKFRAMIEAGEIKKFDSPFFPASQVAAVAGEVMSARIAAAKKDGRARIEALERAVKIEDGIPYMEPSFWYYPTRQSLAVAYLQAGRLDDAEKTFREDLNYTNRNGWSLFGLAETLRAKGQHDAARSVDAEFAVAWKSADTKLDLAWY